MPATLRHWAGFALITIPAFFLAGCETSHDQPKPLEYVLTSPYPQTRTWAVAPIINLAGSRDFDPLTVSDQMFNELQQFQNLNVLPINKTLAAMQRLGIRSISSPRAAQQLADALHADGLVVAAVTAFDPYKPPVVGMTVQLYTTGELAEADVVSSSPPKEISGQRANMQVQVQAPSQPVAQVSAVFNATNQTTLTELKAFAAGRTDYDSALQERRYLVDSDAYMRFVCHAMARRLIEVERQRSGGR